MSIWIRNQSKLSLIEVNKMTASVMRKDDVRVSELQTKSIKGDTLEELNLEIKQFKEQNEIEVVNVKHYSGTYISGGTWYGVVIEYYELKPQKECFILGDGDFLGKYSTEEQMIEVLNAIQRAIVRGEAVYEMPSQEEVEDW